MKMQSNKYASPFLHPVDPVALNIPDYFDIIKNPMDFGTIYQRLINGQITTEAEYLKLMELVFTNAITYNKPQDDVAFMAHELQAYFDKEYTQMKRQASMMQDDGFIITRRRTLKRMNNDDSLSSSQPSRLYSLYRLRKASRSPRWMRSWRLSEIMGIGFPFVSNHTILS